MIIKGQELYSELETKTNIEKEMIESICKFVFNELKECMENPKELAYELPKLGTFNVRFIKKSRKINAYIKYHKLDTRTDLSESEKIKYKELTDLLEKMQNYSNQKKLKREERKTYISGQNQS